MPVPIRPYWDRLRASSIGYRLAHGAFWSVVGAAISQVLMVVSSILIARLLGREHFGEYGIVFNTVGMFNVVASFGLGTTATKYVAEFRWTNPEKVGRIIGLSNIVALITGAVATVALLIAADWLATRTLAAPQLAQNLRIGAGIIFFGALSGAQTGALAGFEAFRVIARINMITGALSFLLVVSGAYFLHLPGALAGQVAALAVTCLLNGIALRKLAQDSGVSLDYAGCWQERSVLVKFSFPAVMAGFLVSPVSWACAAILVNQPTGYAEMGIFNAANSWQKAILFLPGCIGAITLPMLSDMHGRKNWGEFRKALKYNAALNGGVAVCAAVFVSMVSYPIMSSYGKGFETGWPVLVLLAWTAALHAIAGTVGNAIASVGRMWWGFSLNAVWAVTMLLLFYLFRERGSQGLSEVYLVSYLILLLSTVWVSFFLVRSKT